MKIIAISLIVALSLAISACGNSRDSDSDAIRSVVDLESGSSKSEGKSEETPDTNGNGNFDDVSIVESGKDNPGQNDDPNQSDDPSQNNGQACIECTATIFVGQSRNNVIFSVETESFNLSPINQRRVVAAALEDLQDECFEELGNNDSRCEAITMENFRAVGFGQKVKLTESGRSFFECQLRR